jgi:acetyltransferase-like isoleucine patch superfamily enzyme
MTKKLRVEIIDDESGSAFRRYSAIFVGRPGLLNLVKYELLVSFLGPMRGALGYFLRSRLWPRMLGSVGSGTVFGRAVVLRSPHRIRLGSAVVVDDGVVLDAKGESSSIEIGDRILIGRHTALSCNESRIRFGSSISIGPFCALISKKFIDIGSGVSISAHTAVLAGGHASDDPERSVLEQERTAVGITIEDNVWIGTSCAILDGVRIGRNSIVAAGTVVAKDVPPYCTVMGNPARIVQKRKDATG